LYFKIIRDTVLELCHGFFFFGKKAYYKAKTRKATFIKTPRFTNFRLPLKSSLEFRKANYHKFFFLVTNVSLFLQETIDLIIFHQ